jgi:hypothetical protein
MKLDLYLDDVLLIDFKQYHKELNKKERRELRRALKHGQMVAFNIPITDEEELETLREGTAHLYLAGKPKYYKSLRMDEVTLRMVDPIADPPGDSPDPTDPMPPDSPIDNGSSPETHANPEPSTIILLASGLLGLAGVARRRAGGRKSA